MKVNLDQLYEIGDNWRNRTISLANYCKDPKNPIDKRKKAFLLSVIMTQRVLHVADEAFRRTQPSTRLKKGGIDHVKHTPSI